MIGSTCLGLLYPRLARYEVISGGLNFWHFASFECFVFFFFISIVCDG